MRKIHITTVSFPDSKKEIVSGIDMIHVTSAVFFQQYGEKFWLGGMDKVRWPFELKKEEEASLTLRELGKHKVGGLLLRSFRAQMVGAESGKVVMRCMFTVVDLEASEPK